MKRIYILFSSLFYLLGSLEGVISVEGAVPKIISSRGEVLSEPKICQNVQFQFALQESITAKTSTTNQPWSLSSSWVGGIVPKVGDEVVIPTGAIITIDTDVNVKSISIMGTCRIDQTKDVNISTEYVMVMGAGALFECGTEANPYLKRAVITLVGNDPNATIPGHGDGSKAIIVMMGGKLELHGKNKEDWTNLVGTVDPNATKITVAEDISTWEVGDSIVIASTDYIASHAEARKIKSIVGKTITLDTELRFRHYGEINTFKNGTMAFDERAEVGNITRNILIEGDAGSIRKNFGGHIMLMAGSVAHVENIELFNMGQEGIKGKYPFHWHLCGNVSGQYIKGSAIHNSFQRLVVVHGSNYALVQDNVGYKHGGHGYFLEDGDEEFNRFIGNLGLSALQISPGKGLEPQDTRRPATFWITNPNNTFIGNVAAGGFEGFWIIPTSSNIRAGVALSKGGNPRDYPLKEFRDNVAHSNRNRNLILDSDLDKPDASGMKVFTDLQPRYPLKDINGDTLRYIFENCTMYKGGSSGVWSRAGVIEIYQNCKFGDSPLMAFLSFTTAVKNSLFVAQSKNKGTGLSYEKDTILGLQMYNGSCDVDGLHLAGFIDETKICIGNRRSSGKYPNFSANRITFENDGTENNKVNLGFLNLIEDPARSYCFATGMIDLDGSISGIPGVRITPKIVNTKTRDAYFSNKIFDMGFNLPKQTARQVLNLPLSWNAVGSLNTEYALLMNRNSFGWPSTTDEDRPYPEFIYGIRSDGPVVFDQLRKGEDSQWPVIVNEDYIYYNQYHETPVDINSHFKWSKIKNTSVIAAYLNVPSETEVFDDKTKIRSVTSLASLKSSTVACSYLKDNTLYIKYFATNPDANGNTSVKYYDYSGSPLTIKFNTRGLSSKAGRFEYVTLADFELGKDARGTMSILGSMTASVITGDGTDVKDAIDNSNKFIITPATTQGNGYVDYVLNLDKQVWREFNSMSLKFKGPEVEVFVIDADQGEYSLGIYKNTDSYSVSLSNIPLDKADNVIGLKLRFHECYITTATTVELFGITLSLNQPKTPSVSLGVSPVISFVGAQPNLMTSTPSPNGYKWYKGLVSVGGNTRNYTAPTAGTYSVASLVGTCELRSNQLVVSTITGYEEEIREGASISVFPNPSQDGLFNLSQTANWKVTSILGDELKSGNSNQINLLGYPKGVYLVKVGGKVERVVVD